MEVPIESMEENISPINSTYLEIERLFDLLGRFRFGTKQNFRWRKIFQSFYGRPAMT